MPVTFRSTPKRKLSTLVPAALFAQLGAMAAEEGRPDNEVVSLLLCLGLGIDPATYGIARGPRPAFRRQAVTAEG